MAASPETGSPRCGWFAGGLGRDRGEGVELGTVAERRASSSRSVSMRYPCPSYLGQVGPGSHATEEICFWSSCSPSGSPMSGWRFLSSRWYLAMREA